MTTLIEDHPERARIEYDLARGVPVRVVGRKYGLTKDCCYRHLKKIPPQLRAASLRNLLKPAADLEKLRVEEGEALLAGLAMQRARLLVMQDAAMEICDHDLATRISMGIHKNLELVGRYLGEFARQ